jgi:putative membrane protein
MAGVGTEWTFEPLATIGILGGALGYLWCVQQLRAKGRLWPKQRTAAFMGGLAIIAIGALSPLAAYDTKLFSAHVVQHLLFSMFAAPLLCLGAPITLWLQATTRSVQRKTLSVLHSRVARVVTFPVTSWMIFAGTLFILYFSGLYQLTLENRLAHDVLHMHFVASGFLFFSAVVAIDPHPWRMPHGGRMLYVGLTLPVHAFLALALMSATSPVAGDFYALTTGREMADILSDQKLGAAIMWITGDLLAISAVAIVVLQWVKADERSASREDRAQELGTHDT